MKIIKNLKKHVIGNLVIFNKLKLRLYNKINTIMNNNEQIISENEEFLQKPQFKQLFKDWLLDIFATIIGLIEYYIESLVKYYNINENKEKIEKKIFQNKKITNLLDLYIILYIIKM